VQAVAVGVDHAQRRANGRSLRGAVAHGRIRVCRKREHERAAHDEQACEVGSSNASHCRPFDVGLGGAELVVGASPLTIAGEFACVGDEFVSSQT
jgi:hypothetical protein